MAAGLIRGASRPRGHGRARTALAAAAPAAGRGRAEPGPRQLATTTHALAAGGGAQGRAAVPAGSADVGLAGPRRGRRARPPRSSSVGTAPRLLAERGAARRRAGRPGPALAGRPPFGCTARGSASGAVSSTVAARVPPRRCAPDRAGTAGRTSARRDVRAELAAAQGHRCRALGHLRVGLADLHAWQSSFGSLDLQTNVVGQGTRLGRPRAGPRRRLAQPRGAVRVVRAGADAGQPGAAGAGAAGRVDRGRPDRAAGDGPGP